MKSKSFNKALINRFQFVAKSDFECNENETNGQSLNIRILKKLECKLSDIMIFVPRQANSLIQVGTISEIDDILPGTTGPYVNIIVQPFQEGCNPAAWSLNFIRSIDGGFYTYIYTVSDAINKIRFELALTPYIDFIDTCIDPNEQDSIALDSNFDDTIPVDSMIYLDNNFDGTIPVDSVYFLDSNFDGTIVPDETMAFVENTKALIKKRGLSFTEFAQSIPFLLNVTDIEPLKIPDYSSYSFNDVPLRTGKIGDIYYVDIAWVSANKQYFAGKAIDSVRGEVIDADLRDSLEDVFRGLGYQWDLDPKQDTVIDNKPWQKKEYILSVVDKTKNNILMSGNNIATIKKIKKCGKRFYRLAIQDDWRLIISAGIYDNCIVNLAVVNPLIADM